MTTAATYTPRERISFEFNRPQTITLETRGKEQQGRDGIEYRYFVDHQRIMWLPAEAHEQIERADACEGSQLEITRVRKGNQKSYWQVVHIVDEPNDAAPTREQPAPRSRPEPTPAAARPAARPAAPIAQQPTPDAGSDPDPGMYTALCAAIRCAAAAEAFAQQIGRPLAFEAADIRTMAASLYIRATGGR